MSAAAWALLGSLVAGVTSSSVTSTVAPGATISLWRGVAGRDSRAPQNGVLAASVPHASTGGERTHHHD